MVNETTESLSNKEPVEVPNLNALDLNIQAQFLQNILHDSPDGIIIVDNNYRVLSWNQGAENIFGYSKEEIIGESFLKLVPQNLLEEEEIDKLRDELEKVGYVNNYMTTRLTKTGTRITVQNTRAAIRDKNGAIIGFSAIFRDITEQERLQEHLRHLERLAAIGQLVSGLAHEIGTPLNIISGNAELVLEEVKGNKTVEKGVRVIISAAERVSQLISALLQFASGKEVATETVYINKVIKDILKFFEKQMKEERIKVVRKLDKANPSFEGVYNQIEEVILNLVMNAWQAMESGGKLSIKTHGSVPEKESCVAVEIHDTGAGIRPDDMSRIFDPFFTTKDKKIGTGLGLYVTQNIIKRHGGDISLLSKIEKGTQVLVMFPKTFPRHEQQI